MRRELPGSRALRGNPERRGNKASRIKAARKLMPAQAADAVVEDKPDRDAAAIRPAARGATDVRAEIRRARRVAARTVAPVARAAAADSQTSPRKTGKR